MVYYVGDSLWGTIWRLSSMFGAGPTHDLPRTFQPLDLRGIISYPRGLSPSLKILRIIPKKQTYKRAYRGYT